MIGNIYPQTEWERAKLGKFSASEIDDLFKEPKTKEEKAAGGLSVSAQKYINKKATEIITGTIRQMEGINAIDWGKHYEPKAIEKVRNVYPNIEYYGKHNPAFFHYTDFSGCSPDATDEDLYLYVEAKCPENPENHTLYGGLRNGADLKKVNRTYYHQIQFGMLCMANHWGVDFMDMNGLFVSFCPMVRDEYMDAIMVDIAPDEAFALLAPRKIEMAELELAKVVERMKQPSILIATHDKEVNATIINKS